MQRTRAWVSISKRWKVIQQECNKFCATYGSIKARPVSGIDIQNMPFQALEAFKVQHEGTSFHLSHCWRIIKDEEKFKAQYATIMTHGGKEALEEVGEGEKPQLRGKTNSKEDKRYALLIALIATVEGMIIEKHSREEKHRQDKEEQMNAFMEIQRRRLEMEAEKQAKMLEMEVEKQAKMLEIKVANAKTKAK
ncbi:Lectin-domain containing receptor kinase A4.3 [Hordeum vulgare]|nr:Lectin-domain containing receptor kinase A4.3 [Hordeum vulgare]